MTRAVWLLVLASVVSGCGGAVAPLPGAPAGATKAVAATGQPGGAKAPATWPIAPRHDPKKLFAALDVDGNKILTFAEFGRMPCPPVPDDGEFWNADHKGWLLTRYFAHMDTSRSDGGISQEEFAAGLADERILRHALFDTYDEDRNRVLDFGEALVAPVWGTPLGGWQPGQKEMYVQRAIDTMDQDGDMLLTFDEFRR